MRLREKMIRCNFVPAIRYSVVPARKEKQLYLHCSETVNAREKEHSCIGSKVVRYSVNAREKEHFCIGSKVVQYSVNAREKEHFCIGSKVVQYSVNAREKEHFCIGSKVVQYSVNAALKSAMGQWVRSKPL